MKVRNKHWRTNMYIVDHDLKWFFLENTETFDLKVNFS